MGVTPEIPSWKNYHKVFNALFEEIDRGPTSPEVVLMRRGRRL